MTIKRPNIAIIRRIGRRRSRVRIGPRVFVFFAALALVIAAIAISLNFRIEERLWRETIGSGR